MALFALTNLAAQASAQWLQWGGPHRDFRCDSTGLADRWPEEGPRQIWRSELGPGHSAILVDGDKLYTMYRRGDQDVVVACSVAAGARLWETPYDAPPQPDMLLDMGSGPHSTPLIAGDRLYTVGAMVHFHCLDKNTGKILWSHDLVKERGASCLLRGYGGSPIAYKDTVILNVGGTDTSVAAFKQDTGELVWKSERLAPGYPSPLLVRCNGQEHLIVAMGTTRAGLDPATGKTRWSATVDKQLYSIMSSPVWLEPDRVFFTCAYGGGGQLFKISMKDGQYAAEELWQNKMFVMFGNVIRIGDTLYGSSGDFGATFLMAADVATGKILWRKRGFGRSSLLHADGKLLILDEEGCLALATATPAGLEVHSKAKLLEEFSWTVPTLVGTRLYLRDNRTIMALELGTTGNAR